MRAKSYLLLAFVAIGLSAFIVPAQDSYFYDILIGIGINVILATSLNLINGYTGQFSLGHAGFMAVGAYAASYLSLKWMQPVDPGADPNAISAMAEGGFFVALLAGGICAGLVGLLVGVPSLRLKGDYLAIVTLGFNEIIKSVIQNAEPLGAQRGLGGMVRYTNYLWTFGLAAICIYVVVCLVNSSYGRGFLAVRDDEIAAEAMGINTTKYKVLAFVIGAFFAGIAGGLYAHLKQFVHPEAFNFGRSVDIVVMVILGGMGSAAGVCFAAVILTVLPEGLRYLSHWDKLPDWLQHVAENRMILYSLLLIVLMLTRPQGLFGGLSAPKRRIGAK